MPRALFLILLLAASPHAAAQQRAGWNEWSVNLFIDGTKDYEFEGGARLRNDGGYGISFTWAHHLNEHFAFGAETAFGVFDYRARIAPAAGNTAAVFDALGTMETATLRMQATWNLLARPVTPFLTASAGVTILDTNLPSGPPVGGCWTYPGYGTVCGTVAPSHTLTRPSYGAALGLRFDLPENQGFLRAQVGAEWIDLPDALGSDPYYQMRMDFGVRF